MAGLKCCWWFGWLKAALNEFEWEGRNILFQVLFAGKKLRLLKKLYTWFNEQRRKLRKLNFCIKSPSQYPQKSLISWLLFFFWSTNNICPKLDLFNVVHLFVYLRLLCGFMWRWYYLPIRTISIDTTFADCDF